MCQEKNIENVCQIVRALKKKFPNREVSFDDVILTGPELMEMTTNNTFGSLWYGIFTTGSAPVQLSVYGDAFFMLDSGSQIIELVNSFNVTDPNVMFRGYEIVVDGIDFNSYFGS